MMGGCCGLGREKMCRDRGRRDQSIERESKSFLTVPLWHWRARSILSLGTMMLCLEVGGKTVGGVSEVGNIFQERSNGDALPVALSRPKAPPPGSLAATFLPSNGCARDALCMRAEGSIACSSPPPLASWYPSPRPATSSPLTPTLCVNVGGCCGSTAGLCPWACLLSLNKGR